MSLPTPPRQPDAIPVLNSTPLPAFSQTWQLRPPEDAQILIVKGTFDLVQGAPATPAEEQLFPLGPELLDGAEEALRYPGDMAFFKPRCDVMIAGHVYASESHRRVRRAHLDLGRTLQYSIAAVGDRTWSRGAPSEPKPFERIEIRPERAFGGPGDELNPVGVGRHAKDGSPLPNLEDPDRLIRSQGDRPTPTFTTPVAQTWPSRLKHAGDYGGDWLKRRAPYFPESFSWDYFQCAPPALQVAYPKGDEWYRLRGFRPNDETLEGRLPCLEVRAFAQSAAQPDRLHELPLNLDTVWFDPDQLVLVLAWRGAIPSGDQYGSDIASFFVTAEPSGEPCPMDEVRRRFVEAHDAEYVREAEEEEPDPEPEPDESPPDGYRPPAGLTPQAAAALGLPAWAATVDGPPLAVREPPPARAALEGDDLESKLASDASLSEEDLSHCDLSGRDLSGRDLSRAILIGANLERAVLQGTNLAGAVLTDAQLTEADLMGANLEEAVLDGALLERSRLDQARLVDASMNRTRLAQSSMEGIVMDGAVAFQADFMQCKLDGASLVATDFTESRLEEASLVGANMEDVRLYAVAAARLIADDAIMIRCRIDGAIFIGASFERVDATDSSMRACDFSDANLSEAKLEQSILEDVRLDRANVNRVEAKECRWPRAKATEATFVKSNLMGGYFEGAKFEHCDMRGANLYEAETFRARFLACRLEHAILGESGLG